jgi:hypothetical protein
MKRQKRAVTLSRLLDNGGRTVGFDLCAVILTPPKFIPYRRNIGDGLGWNLLASKHLDFKVAIIHMAICQPTRSTMDCSKFVNFPGIYMH